MTQMTAMELIAQADAARCELDDTPADVGLPGAREQLEREISFKLAAAQIVATLDVAAAFREWTNVGREGLDAATPAALQLIPSVEGDITSLANFPFPRGEK